MSFLINNRKITSICEEADHKWRAPTTEDVSEIILQFLELYNMPVPVMDEVLKYYFRCASCNYPARIVTEYVDIPVVTIGGYTRIRMGDENDNETEIPISTVRLSTFAWSCNGDNMLQKMFYCAPCNMYFCQQCCHSITKESQIIMGRSRSTTAYNATLSTKCRNCYRLLIDPPQQVFFVD